MFILKKLTIVNFLSIGAIPQVIDFETNEITLILGINTDMISENQLVSRNGAGKSALVSALTYALYGKAISSDVKADALINYINTKNMLVLIEYSIDGRNFKIERGRKPSVFKYFIDAKAFNTPDSNEAQGESKLTQKEIEKDLGMSFHMFNHLVVLNTSAEPFLKLSSGKQREFIEELLGMKILSEKAEVLKELTRLTKDEIRLEEVKIDTIKQNNVRIEKNITDIINKCDTWELNKVAKVFRLEQKLTELNLIDIESELLIHKNNQEIKELDKVIQQLKKDNLNTDRQLLSLHNSNENAANNLEKALENKCPTCDQGIHDETHTKIINELTTLIENNSKKVNDLEVEKSELTLKLCEKETARLVLDEIEQTHYSTIDKAYNHKSEIALCENNLSNAKTEENPYFEQIESLQNAAIQEIDYEVINELSKAKDHQEFLYKLLTDNGSFIRKKIIDQNIAFLNSRLMKYLEKLALPHNVIFQNDLTVNITNFGHELDFGNLSRGEQTRLILALSWAFRDIYEILTRPINVMMIDELLDSGADQSCVEQSIAVLRKMNQDFQKSIFVISHHDSLISKIPQVLLVTKENGFSSFALENNYVRS